MASGGSRRPYFIGRFSLLELVLGGLVALRSVLFLVFGGLLVLLVGGAVLLVLVLGVLVLILHVFHLFPRF